METDGIVLDAEPTGLILYWLATIDVIGPGDEVRLEWAHPLQMRIIVNGWLQELSLDDFDVTTFRNESISGRLPDLSARITIPTPSPSLLISLRHEKFAP